MISRVHDGERMKCREPELGKISGHASSVRVVLLHSVNEGESVVIESTVRRKKRGGLDVFQSAETVEPEAWGDRLNDLQDRISALELEQASKAGTPPVHDDAHPPHSKRPDLTRHPSVLGEDKGQVELEFKLYDAILTPDATCECIIRIIKPSTSRTSDSTGSLTPSGSRSAPVPVPAPAPIPPRDDPDFVWDVFYHRAGLTNEIRCRRKSCDVTVGRELLARRTGLPNSLADAYASASESEEEDEADEDSNGAPHSRSQSFISDYSVFGRTAEEYYKNDYPDEESSAYGTEGSDLSLDDSNDYHDWR
ncbi:hypothetical protein EDB83DRAFT_2318014 [Lactarius deliciosus]|nr:hypothetical protein EDB83DRAFT_2318014 [Lactarius deliciosus]